MTNTIPLTEIAMFLPYGLECEVKDSETNKIWVDVIEGISDECVIFKKDAPDYYFIDSEIEIKPIVRPLSSMTKDEEKEIDKQVHIIKIVQWYCSKHFDICNWIEKNLAIDKTKL
jgi:hypothetical protein